MNEAEHPERAVPEELTQASSGSASSGPAGSEPVNSEPVNSEPAGSEPVNSGLTSSSPTGSGLTSSDLTSSGLTSSVQDRIQQAICQRELVGFSPVAGELPIPTALELAVLTFVHHRYRNIPEWRVQKVYSFTLEGIFHRTYVEAWGAAEPIRFTPEEAIAIAGHLSQQDCPDW